MNECYLMDCMEFMKICKDKEIDLCICDPPYGIENKITNFDIKKENRGNKFAIKYDLKKWDIRPDKKYFNELFRISKNQIICGANYFVNFLPVSRGWVFWDKMGNNFTSVNNELIFTSFDISIKTFKRCHGKDKGFFADYKVFHPTQKPVALYKWLLQNYAKPNWTIFDSHVGSGSIRIACHDLGFNFIGCEIDKDYWEAQEKRFKEHIQQNELFEKEEIKSLVFNK